MRENRGPWYLFTGLLIGVLLGFLYARLIAPPQVVDAGPNLLRSEARDQYRVMIALAYQADGNLGRARQRLALLNDSSPAQALVVQAEQTAATNSAESKALAALAELYNPRPTHSPAPPTAVTPSATTANSATLRPSLSVTIDPAQAVRSATPIPTQTATLTPLATWTARPTAKPSPTLGAPYSLLNREVVCDPNLPAMLIVEVRNNAGEPVAGVALRVTWPPNGVDVFYTGLMPEINAGTADFQMEPNQVYAVRAGANGEIVPGVTVQDCTQSGGGQFFGGVKIIFKQP